MRLRVAVNSVELTYEVSKSERRCYTVTGEMRSEVSRAHSRGGFALLALCQQSRMTSNPGSLPGLIAYFMAQRIHMVQARPACSSSPGKIMQPAPR